MHNIVEPETAHCKTCTESATIQITITDDLNIYSNMYTLLAVRLVTRIRPSGAAAIPVGFSTP